jgi:carboxylesterase type B
MYQIVGDRPTAAKLGALDLVNDARYTLPVEVVADKLRTASKRVFRYVIDQPNPWLPSSRAHHAVDILFLFDGLIYRLILRLALLERRCGNVGFVLSTVMDLGLQI